MAVIVALTATSTAMLYLSSFWSCVPSAYVPSFTAVVPREAAVASVSLATSFAFASFAAAAAAVSLAASAAAAAAAVVSVDITAAAPLLLVPCRSAAGAGWFAGCLLTLITLTDSLQASALGARWQCHCRGGWHGSLSLCHRIRKNTQPLFLSSDFWPGDFRHKRVRSVLYPLPYNYTGIRRGPSWSVADAGYGHIRYGSKPGTHPVNSKNWLIAGPTPGTATQCVALAIFFSLLR